MEPIRIITYSLTVLVILSLAIVVINHYTEYRKFRKSFKLNDHVVFWLGQKRQSGRILKIKWRKALVRNFFDKKTYNLQHYKISKL